MQSIEIACPKCSAILKLKDRHLLGRRGKCATCGHVFVMVEPEPVKLEQVASETAMFVSQLAGHASAPGIGEQYANGPGGQRTLPIPDMGLTTPKPLNVELISEPASPGMAAYKEIRLRGRKFSKLAWGVGAGTVVLLIGLGWWFSPQINEVVETQSKNKESADDSGIKVIVEKSENLLYKEELEKNLKFAKANSPTKGKPVDVHYIPVGSRIIFHLKPAELWKDEGLAQEVRYCLGPIAEWAQVKLKEICLREPAEIEDALICLALGNQSAPPDVSAVVRLTKELKRSEMLQMFQGQPNDQYGYPVYIAGERAYLIQDQKTYATCPAHLAEEMVKARGRPQPTDPAIEEILAESDQDRHFSLIFAPADLSIAGYQESLIPELARPLFSAFLDWLGDDVESVIWSMHLGEDFRTDMVVRSNAKIPVMRAQRRFKDGLDELPARILALVEQMKPQRVGPRQLIGRYPAMLKALQLSTLMGINEEYVYLSAQLPERAAPNLALGTLLAWDESTRTAFAESSESTLMAANKGASDDLPEKIADRLKTKIDVDFRRTPLQDAFAYIAEETSVNIEIDGDALKFSGYTKNMPQTFKLTQEPGTAALLKIMEK
ncbi:MAG: hypothetical protein ACKVT0_22015, partial [Planctomycetaceae bacterium]